MFRKFFGKHKTIHFIGIGGIGMSAIAKILFQKGYTVTGSDLAENEVIQKLKTKGIAISIGHSKKNIKKQNVVVTSSAISLANPEILAAKEKNIPIITRGEMLAELMRIRIGIAITGTHGKTTTTSLVSAILVEADTNPTSVIGGKWFGIDSNAELGSSDYFICEADESDKSFLKLSPIFSIITNIDIDHMDCYKTEEQLSLAFLEFVNKTPFFGKNILCFENERVRKILPEINKPYLTYGFDESCDVYATDVEHNGNGMTYDVYVKNGSKKFLGYFKLNMHGNHNVLNSLAAISIALELGIDVKIIQSALDKFKGVDRRMSLLGQWKNFDVIDDYGHHPTEIEVTLKALRKKYDNIVCIFQPHRYTRTLEHYKKFSEVLNKNTDKLYLTEIYSAGEKKIENVSSQMIADEIKNKTIEIFETQEALQQKIVTDLENSSGVILTIGAGNIYQLAKKLATKN